jgi:hypothetical protein
MSTYLKILPRLLSFAAAALVLFAAVNADAQLPTTRSVAIPPIPPGQVRIWIYASPESTMPNNYPITQAITLNGAKVGYLTLGAAFYRDVPPGHYVIAAPGFYSDSLDPSQKATVDLAAGQDIYLQLEALGWTNGGSDSGNVNVYYIRPMPPQTGYTAVAQLAFLGGN